MVMARSDDGWSRLPWSVLIILDTEVCKSIPQFTQDLLQFTEITFLLYVYMLISFASIILAISLYSLVWYFSDALLSLECLRLTTLTHWTLILTIFRADFWIHYFVHIGTIKHSLFLGNGYFLLSLLWLLLGTSIRNLYRRFFQSFLWEGSSLIY